MAKIIKFTNVCKRCVMDDSDELISFDENGVCNHCNEYDRVVKPYLLSKAKRTEKLEQIISKIKQEGKNRKYDCLIGLSGGVDSSYVVYLAKKYNLRSLVVHFDNGWDSELAIKNIENIISNTGFDYYNYLVNWEEFKGIQCAYFKASVVDVEVPTDMAISSLIPQIALKYNIKYILSGANVETEFTMGANWNYSKSDRSNLLGICLEGGIKEFKTFPYYSPYQQFISKVKNVKVINILAYDECNYELIKKKLANEFGWTDYGVKHGESIFTKFYQSYYLPKKFGIDKRKAHFSDQINSGFIDRERALEILNSNIYSSIDEETREYNYVIKKLGFSGEEFSNIMNAPIRPHSNYPVEQPYGNWTDRLFLKVYGFQFFTTILRKTYRVYENLVH